MSGHTAYNIATKMKTQLSDKNRGLTTWELALSNFCGFMDCLVTCDLCTREESGMMIAEFTRLLLEPVII